MVITSSSSNVVDTLVNALGQAFPITDLGQLSYFLGLELKYMPDGVLMSQTKYITDILTKTNMLAANPISSPMSASTKLSKFDSPTFDNVTLFRSVVGSLQYLSLTRPDISFSVNKTLIKELGFSLASPPVLWCDNLGAMYLTANPVYHSCTKYMDIDFHFVRDRVAAKTLQVSFCNSNDQLADIFTKPLVADKFTTLRTSLTVCEPPMDSRGHVNTSKSLKQNDSTNELDTDLEEPTSTEASGISL
ncbi:hypothetical protein F2P56_006145 [Juglans regia]|uniref:Reverse transcriptase Ty1/copia-type domain-containing protein n=1 Tax=Juglans regia TaxID=51240 RepID=A0A834D312_JUGRE|nr:hypothetical protein F2P56_006145 [Juglans regia]